MRLIITETCRRKTIACWIAAICFFAALTSHCSEPIDSGTDNLQFKNHDTIGSGILETMRQPDYFTANKGQTSKEIRFYSIGDPLIGFEDGGITLILENITRERSHRHESASLESSADRPIDQQTSTKIAAFSIRFEGANPVTPIGVDQLSFNSNFFIGNDSAKWVTKVPNYHGIEYKNVFDRVDFLFSRQDGKLKYDVIVQPGADLAAITMRFEGADSVVVHDKDILIRTAMGDFRDVLPSSYQDANESVECRYVSRGVFSFGFGCDRWDKAKPLVIDPLIFSTFLGGSLGSDGGFSIAADGSGNAYVAGATSSVDFPSTSGAFDTVLEKCFDAFVTKIDSTGSMLVYSTFIGGNGGDIGYSLALDSANNVYLTGNTSSTDFPVTSGAFDISYNGPDGGFTDGDAFVLKLNAPGDSLIYSTYLGGSDEEHGEGIAVDSAGNAFVVGNTLSLDFPTTSGAFMTSNNGGPAYFPLDGFLARLNSTGSALAYSTYIGGSDMDWIFSLYLDTFDNAYVTGGSMSCDFPTTSEALDTSCNGAEDVIVAKFNSTGTGLLYSTFLGDSGNEKARSIVVNDLGEAFLTGMTGSNSFPTTPDAYDRIWDGNGDAFITRLAANGSAITYSTFLGGKNSDWGRSILLDSSADVYVVGWTWSTDFPTTKGSLRENNSGISDVFVTQLNLDNSSLVYSSYLGGSSFDGFLPLSINVEGCLDSDGFIYIAGDTSSPDFPISGGAFDEEYSGAEEVFVTKLKLGVNTAPTIRHFSTNPSPANEGDPVVFNIDAFDSDGDSLVYSFDFESDGIFDFNTSSSIVSHIYGDDFRGEAALRVSDGKSDVSAKTTILVNDVLPTDSLSLKPPEHEGDVLRFSSHVSDPGSDDIILKWSWGDGTPDETSICYNDDFAPDPYPSTDIHPRDITDAKSHSYGDNGAYSISVFISDDDSGSDGTTLNLTATPDNLPPSVTVTGGTNIDEGQSISLTATAMDPGSDDLTFAWSWGEGSSEKRAYFNDGANPDPPQSPGGKWPFTATDTATHPYGDDGLYPLTLTVTDDDGGSASWSGQVVVRNLPPTIAPFGPFTISEGEPISITATATDAGSDDLAFTWHWTYGPTDTAIFYNDGIGPDLPQSPFSTFPFAATDDSSHTYGDDCPCDVFLTVTDDDGGSATYTATVSVLNLPPSFAGKVDVYARGSLILRVAGEKWHDIAATIYRNGVEEMAGRVVRVPGSPDDQAVTLGDVGFDLLSSDIWSAKVVYTPEDDPVNGQPNGADSAWLIFRSEHGNESSSHHTFNVQHNETWTWEVSELRTLLVGIPLDFKATGTDLGSDDLTFTWDWGDGTPATAMTSFNDGIGPDPFPSPGGTFPFTATVVQTHTYANAGRYAVTLRIFDDDGGVREMLIVLIN